MARSTIIPVVFTQQLSKDKRFPNSNRYSVQDHGQGYRTYSYEFDLVDYQSEQIDVLLDEYGTLRIRATRPPCYDFHREYHLGGPNVETTLVRNTIDKFGRLRVDVDVRPRRFDEFPTSLTNHLRFDLHGYRPENVHVRINRQGLLKINATHFENSFENHINREYFRQYQLPSTINPDLVRARMDENDILTIDLPPASSTQRFTTGDYWRPVYGGVAPVSGFCCCNLM